MDYVHKWHLRAKYGHSVTPVDFARLVTSYFQQQRSSGLATEYSLPSIDATFKPRGKTMFPDGVEVNGIKCFERRSICDTGKTVASAQPPPKVKLSDASMNEPPSKKRKLKASRVVALAQMLDGL